MKKSIQEEMTLFTGGFADFALVNTQEALHSSSVPSLGHHRDMAQIYIEPDYNFIRLREDRVFNIGEDWEMKKNL